MILAIMLLPLALLAYAWGLYPLALPAVARGRERRRAARGVAGGLEATATPSVVVVFSAYNEEEAIEARLRNLLALDYPADRLRVWVGVDGATDATAARARAVAEGGGGRVRVRVFERNRGKVAVLKDLVDEARAEWSPDVLAFTDANTAFRPDALRQLVAPFADKRIGGVCGKLVFVDSAGVETDEGTYWRWESRLKAMESAVDSCLGANGAIYAIRAGLFWIEIPDNTVIDDFTIGMKVRERGGRLVFDPAAVAMEPTPPKVADEWRRRTRIGMGDFQSLLFCARCLSPRYGWFAWCFWSHKVLRWFTPHLMLLAVVVAALAQRGWSADGGPVWWSAALGSLILAGAAGIAALFATQAVARRVGVEPPVLLRQACYFFTIQAALLVGFARAIRGGVSGAWVRSPRAAGGPV
jgi:cellulose synthase/poly-beta-1,6-N-acetylglucosamine synthase-like glycosyltransferase